MDDGAEQGIAGPGVEEERGAVVAVAFRAAADDRGPGQRRRARGITVLGEP